MRISQIIQMVKHSTTARSSLLNVLTRGVGMVLALVYTPLLLNYLGDEAYGVWATVLSVINWISVCDLGIGNGLRNLLTKELSQKDYDAARKTISTAYVILSIISAALLAIITVITLLVNWNALLNTSLVVKPMILITFVFIILNMVFALSNSILVY